MQYRISDVTEKKKYKFLFPIHIGCTAAGANTEELNINYTFYRPLIHINTLE